MKKIGFPFFLYLSILFLFCPYLLRHFSTHFFSDGADGLQNVWNLWWVNRSISVLKTLPWFTDYLHFPHGTSLIGQTLSPFNGFVGIFLLKFLSLVQAYNTIVIFSFVMGGITAYWLCHEICGSYTGSLIGGAIFTFSNYHFMHAESHLQLVSLEWIPLFLLLWVRFCENPGKWRGIAASGALLLVILCDYYYFFFCVISGILFYCWIANKRKDLIFILHGNNLIPFSAFILSALMTSGILVAFLMYTNHNDPLLGSHASRNNSMDLLSPFIWGPHWLFRDWVKPLWRPLSLYPNESSVYIGISIILLSIYAVKKRSASQVKYLGFWCILAVFFAILSLGPNLHIAGKEISLGPKINYGGKESNLLLLPYAFFWFLFPPLRISGVPVRMMIMVQLAAAILAAGGIKAILSSRSPWKFCILGMLIAVAIFEYLPKPIPLTKPELPSYIKVLKDLPDGAVLDVASPATWSLFYQTYHQKKMGFGYISRTPSSVFRQDQNMYRLLVDGKWEQLARDFHFKYIIKSDKLPEMLQDSITTDLPLKKIDGTKKVFQSDCISIYQF